MRGMGRSVLAVIVGFMTMMIVAVAATLALVKTMGLHTGNPTPGYLVYNVLVALGAAFLGGFTTGSIAEERRVRHGYILAMVMLLMAALSYVHYTGQQPPWYQAMLVAVPPVLAVAGAKAAQVVAVRR